MKHYLLKLGVFFLLLGAIVNVAVTWGFEAYDQRAFWTKFTADPMMNRGEIWYTVPGWSAAQQIRHMHRASFDALPVVWVNDWLCLPIEPLLPSFAINTIFYAVLLWVLWFAPGKIRRFIRVRGHRCPACGYKIDSAPSIGPRCSECGAELPTRLRLASP